MSAGARTCPGLPLPGPPQLRFPLLLVLPLLALAASAMLPSAAAAQIVSGRTVDAVTRKPIPQVEVALLDTAGVTRRTVLSNEYGEFMLVVADTGRYSVRGARLGYAVARSRQIELRYGQTLEVELRMSVKPIQMEPLKVLAAARSLRQRDLNEYYQRVEENPREHWGWIYPRKDIERVAGWTYGQFMQREIPFSFTSKYLHCTPTVYWDGHPAMPGSIDTLMSMDDIEGVEIYRSGTGPPNLRFFDANDCLLILVWSRPLDRRNARAFRFTTLVGALAGFAVIGWLIKLAGF